MRISQKLLEQQPFFSFEFFPPKSTDAEATLYATIEALKPLDPGFVSITYGAGGSTRSRTMDVARRLENDAGFDVMAHLACSGSTADELRETLRALRAAGIENLMALRGDPPKNGEVAGSSDFAYASDFIAMVRAEFDFCIGAACYPEKHPEAASLDADLAALSAKVRTGVDFLVTQLFFDNARYFEFVRQARTWGITVPIIPGIMPITNVDQIQRFTAMCGATIPPHLVAELDLRRDDPQAVSDLGVAYMTLQAADLLARGAPGVHFYTLNRSPATRAVVSGLLAARAAW